MRLLLIANDFPHPFDPNKGIFNLNLAKALNPEHEMRVICPIPWVDEWRARRRNVPALAGNRRAVLQGIEVHYPRYYYPPKLWRSSYGWFYWQNVRPTITSLLKTYTPHAVLGYWAHPDGQAAVKAARLANVPSAVIVGGSDVLLTARDPRRRQCIASVLAAADAVVTVSQQLKDKTIDLGIPPEKIHVWSQGVDAEKFRPGDRGDARRRLNIPPDCRAVVWVGRLVPVKALDVLLNAGAILHRRQIEFRLYLVGGGPLRHSLETLAASLGLTDLIWFVGERSYEQLPDWYRAANLVVLPSWSEGLPNVLREAVACNVPFVATRVGGIAEIARDECDRLVPPGDPATLADAIAAGLTDAGSTVPPDRRVPDWTESAHALVNILQPLLAASTPNSPSPHNVPHLIASTGQTQ